MKYWLVSLIWAFSATAFAATPCPQFFFSGQLPTAKNTELVCHTGYAVGYNNAWGEPSWSAEVITPASAAEGEKDKRNGNFHEDTALPLAERVSPKVYSKSGYDLGHMTPAGDRGADKSETFSTANMVPQKPNLNRKVWAGIEASLRNLATAGATVYVITGPTVASQSDKLPSNNLAGRVAIPTNTWKAVYVSGKGAEAWDCTNNDTPICGEITVSALMTEIGFDPMPGLSADVKNLKFVLPEPTKGNS